MSRETLKSNLLETAKESEKNQLDYIITHFQELAASDNKEDVIFLENIMCRYANTIKLRRFLEIENYDPFLSYSAKYAPGSIPSHPEGITIWEVDDVDIEIIEEKPEHFLMSVIDFLQNTDTTQVWESLQPQVIRNEYISIVERCIHKKKSNEIGRK